MLMYNILIFQEKLVHVVLVLRSTLTGSVEGEMHQAR